MPVASAPTVAEILLERVVDRLEQYRGYVHRSASGWALSREEADDIEKLLRELELPSWSLRRDVDALRNMWAAETDHRKLELAWMFPHLFSAGRQWAELRRSERGARRRVMAELREAMSLRK